MIIHILNNRVLTFTKTDSGEYFRFIGDVIMQQGTDTLYCDSLIQNKTTNILSAYGHVKVAQAGGTQGTCDFLKYASQTKLALMTGDVHLTDGKNKLWCEELTYNLGTKVGVYENNGTLTADSTFVKSQKGIYNVNTKDARFTGNVVVADPGYYTSSEDMGYNTESKLTHFYAQSVVTGDSGRTIIQTTGGMYDSKLGLAAFDTHSSIWYDGYYIEGDTLHYNKQTGYGYVYGNVVGMDTAHQSKMFCGKTTYNRKKRIMWAWEKPILQTVKDKDTTYMRADTFYSAPMPIPDTVKLADTSVIKSVTIVKKEARKKEQKTAKAKGNKPPVVAPVAVVDTGWADTTAPLFFTGFHNVRIFSDSMQGVCDSIVYTQSDSTIRMIGKPILWSGKSQVTGDTVCILLDSNKVKYVYVPNNAFVVSLAAPVKAELYNQVQGKTLKAFFKNNDITHLIVMPEAEAIYYPKDDSGRYLGVSQASSEKMSVFFNNREMKKIKLEVDVKQTLTPLEKADLPNMRLSRFKWLDAKRPKTKEELFD